MEPPCISPHLENSVDLTSFGHTYSGSKVNVALPSPVAHAGSLGQSGPWVGSVIIASQFTKSGRSGEFLTGQTTST